MERMRANGTGLDYFQGDIRCDGSQLAAEGVNQHVRYFKPDIIAWRDRGKISSTVQAAKLKGQVFATIIYLAEKHPFYIYPASGGVDGMVEHTPIETVIARLGDWEIVWMPATEAGRQRWSNLAAYKELAGRTNRFDRRGRVRRVGWSPSSQVACGACVLRATTLEHRQSAGPPARSSIPSSLAPQHADVAWS